MKVRFKIKAVPATGGQPYDATMMSVIFPRPTSQVAALEAAWADFNGKFGTRLAEKLCGDLWWELEE